jgi:hypothetical protein
LASFLSSFRETRYVTLAIIVLMMAIVVFVAAPHPSSTGKNPTEVLTDNAKVVLRPGQSRRISTMRLRPGNIVACRTKDATVYTRVPKLHGGFVIDTGRVVDTSEGELQLSVKVETNGTMTIACRLSNDGSRMTLSAIGRHANEALVFGWKWHAAFPQPQLRLPSQAHINYHPSPP